MPAIVLVGAQWGDEGKGKIVDWLAARADVVVRFQGGHNAGHTLVVGDTTYKLSLLPSGIVTGTLSLIGNGVVLDPWALKAEIATLTGQGVTVTPETLRIADNCPLIVGSLYGVGASDCLSSAEEEKAWKREGRPREKD